MHLIFRLAHQHLEFRIPEIQAMIKLFQLESVLKLHIDETQLSKTPFLRAELLDDCCLASVTSMATRCVSVVTLYQVFVGTSTRMDLVDAMKSIVYPGPFESCRECSFKYVIDSFGRKYSGKESRAIIRDFEFLPIEGKIDMESPQVIYTILVRSNVPNLPQVPEEWYYARFLTAGNRGAIDYFDLKKRSYIGITSMDAELSLYMCNMAQLTPGTLVLDPFVGTGSFLVISAFFGAFVMGSDIDGRQMRGTTTGNIRLAKKNPILTNGLDISSNARQYGLENRMLDTLVYDITVHPWARNEIFDAIVTDPPYGVRAGAKKIVAASETFGSTPQDSMNPCYPKTEAYYTDEVIQDLIEFSARYLRVGGRLVYWQPTLLRDSYPGQAEPIEGQDNDFDLSTMSVLFEQTSLEISNQSYRELSKQAPLRSFKRIPLEIPEHDAMRVVAASEQKLSGWSRWLVTLEKVSRYEPSYDLKISKAKSDFRHFGDDLFKRQR